MTKAEPRDHHYAPQFYLRNFAVDPERRKITTVAKSGHVAVWSKRSIETLGYERDFYVHMSGDAPVSVETAINRRLETPISASDTWRKIMCGKSSELDETDRPVLYALIRHLHARTPHALETARQLAQMAADPSSTIPFSDQERAMYAQMRASPGGVKAFINLMSASLVWTADEFASCAIAVYRSPIPLKASTTPVLAINSPDHPALSLPLPGQTPYLYALPLDPRTLVTLTLGDFGGTFVNYEISADEARGFNRQYLGQFAFFESIRHLITDRDDIVEEMTWGPYDFVEGDERKMVFRRR